MYILDVWKVIGIDSIIDMIIVEFWSTINHTYRSTEDGVDQMQTSFQQLQIDILKVSEHIKADL